MTHARLLHAIARTGLDLIGLIVFYAVGWALVLGVLGTL